MPRASASRRLAVRNFPYSLSFDGSGDYVDFGDFLDFERTDPFSVCGYATASAFDATSSTLIRKSNTAVNNAQGWFAGLDANKRLTFFLSANSTTLRINLQSNTVWKANTPYFWGWSYDGLGLAAGVEFVVVEVGKQLTAFEGKQAPVTDGLSSGSCISSQVLRLGASSNGLRLWTGLQQKVAVCNAALSLADFQNIYYDNKYPASLVASWIGENTEGSGATVSDEVGSVDGTITGATWSSLTAFLARQNASPRSPASARVAA